jgi:transcription-repair coupling factor (superfamily II helicase)
LPDSIQIRLQRMYQGARYFAQAKALSVPMPRINGEPLEDSDLIDWVAQLLSAIFPAPVAVSAPSPE